MPPRFAYWTILIDNAPTAFRARDAEELLPTLAQLKRTNENVVLKWFSGGTLWDSPEAAREARRGPKVFEKRGADWRPGGEHRDPRARFDKKKPKPDRDRRPYGDRPPQNPYGGDRPPQQPCGARPPHKSYGDRRPFKPGGQKPFGARPPFKPGGQKPFGARPPFKPGGQKSFGARPPFKPGGQKPFGARPPFKPGGQKPFGARPPFKPGGQKPFGAKPFGSKPGGKFGDRPRFPKRFDRDRPQGGPPRNFRGPRPPRKRDDEE